MTRVRWGWRRAKYRIRPVSDWAFNSKHGRYWGRLGASALVNVVVLAWFHTRQTSQDEDLLIIAYIACVFAFAWIVMLRANRHGWSFRSLGLFGTVGGDAALYGLLALGGYGVLTFTNVWRQDIVRTLLVVGGTQLAISLLWWTVATRFGFRDREGGEP